MSIVRGCQITSKSTGCVNETKDGAIKEICYCNTDRCNGNGRISGDANDNDKGNHDGNGDGDGDGNGDGDGDGTGSDHNNGNGKSDDNGNDSFHGTVSGNNTGNGTESGHGGNASLQSATAVVSVFAMVVLVVVSSGWF